MIDKRLHCVRGYYCFYYWPISAVITPENCETTHGRDAEYDAGVMKLEAEVGKQSFL